MLKIMMVLCLIGKLCCPLTAYSQSNPPHPYPDRVILTFCADPSTSIAVTWRTDTTVIRSVAEIAVANPIPTEKREHPDPKQVEGMRTVFIAKDTAAYYHSVKFTALTPATKYAYRVGDGKLWSEWFHFTTAGDQPAPFSFIYFGDAQNNIKSMWSRCIREAVLHLPDARFMVHAGDLISGNNDWEWAAWFQAGGWVNGTIPSIPSSGNHEHLYDLKQERYTGLHPQWRHLFTLPENGPPGLEETVYYVDYQGVRMISLNSTSFLYMGSDTLQLEWLEKLLADNPNRWTILTFHHPVHGVEPWVKLTADKRIGKALLYTELRPLLDKYKVDLVLQGHTHQYNRGSDIELSYKKSVDSAILNRKFEKGGTMYVVSVSGPKMYSLVTNTAWMDKKAQGIQLFQIISILGDVLKFESYTATGVLFDAFELRKRKNRPNKVVNIK